MFERLYEMFFSQCKNSEMSVVVALGAMAIFNNDIC